jgi:hypothetical protein
VSILRAGYLILAQRLQEASDSLSSNEMRDKLSDAVRAAHQGSNQYASYRDHTGDEDSGDCLYDCGPDTMRAPYSKGTDSSDDDYTVDTSKASKVQPRLTYVDVPDDSAGYAAMESAKLYTKGPLPLCERFVSKKERDAAGSGDFAGKGKSFPILKAGDVSAAASSIGRAGSDNYSTDVIKRNIIRIAKAKGWTSELPKAWQDGETDSKESQGVSITRHISASGIKLVEMTTRTDEAALDLIESAAGAEMEIKLIAPGKGSSAFYTPEALKQAASDKVFDKGTQIYINHATRAEESERPEGDWHKLVGALKEPAYYLESHKQGPGLYSKAAFSPDMAPLIKSKAPYSGMSIRANGHAVMESGRPKLREGVPVLKKFTSAESVDIVTKAGAGGMILTESARSAQGETPMTVEEKALLSRLVEKEVRREAIELGARTLEGVALTESAKMYVIETVVDRGVPTEAGALDSKKFVEAINAETRRFGGAIGAGPKVVGMGAAPVVEITEAQRAEAKARQKAEDDLYTEAWAGLLDGNVKLAEAAVKGRAS